jgi:serine/threonine protein kinase
VVSEAADMWALGVIAFELLTGQRTFPFGTTKHQVFDQISGRSPLPWEDPAGYTQRAAALRGLRRSVMLCLSRDPAQRPSAERLLVAWNHMFDSFSSVGGETTTAGSASYSYGNGTLGTGVSLEDGRGALTLETAAPEALQLASELPGFADLLESDGTGGVRVSQEDGRRSLTRETAAPEVLQMASERPGIADLLESEGEGGTGVSHAVEDGRGQVPRTEATQDVLQMAPGRPGALEHLESDGTGI